MFSRNAARIERLFDQMKLKGISERSVRRLQTAYTSCAVIYEFDSQQVDMLSSLQGPDKQVVLGGDGRCDNPGYSAKYGRISKKLETRAKKKDTGDIRPWIKSIVNHTYWVAASSGEDQNVKIQNWTSISNHIINKHVRESDVFPQCIYGELEEQRAWLKQGSRSHKLKVIESKFLLNDLEKLSKVHQTYGLKVYHSLVNQYAPKITYFFPYAMKARIYIAALHYNENGNRQQAVTKAGILKWKKSYPKATKGEQCVVKPQKFQATYDYVGALLKRTFDRRNNLSSIKEALEDFNVVYQRLPPLTASNPQYVRRN
ncbi:unnamed protein product [Mytilus coruscus]|uniref:Uncharacterized protein n=1 Tax=Mytilus coruscus TaxID=42192 RepID=A0A6J8BB46_MYTCO|nr:unnamed protein product [Mytilus coruscus]